MRRSLVVGNWKMNGSLESNKTLLSDVLQHWQGVHHAEVAVCVPSIYIAQAADMLGNTNIGYGAQDCSVHTSGAYTGETSVSMLTDLECGYVIVGHSERRQYHGETNQIVAEKALAAQQAGLIPIVCVGETLQQREAGQTLAEIGSQLDALRRVVDDTALASMVIAYEPVWAIGTGLSASPEQAQDVHSFIRSKLGSVAESIRLLYGGSVKPGNAESLFVQADIDGALVGGAALVADDFIGIARAAEPAT